MQVIARDGQVRTLETNSRLSLDRDGKPKAIHAIARDITERKKYEEHLSFTTRELSHRTKNVLAVVLAMVRQIGKQTASFEQFEERFSGCIKALAFCHDLLVESDWQGADLRSLIALQVAPFGGLDDKKIVATGPAITLSPQATQLIGLALHELATNAAKHGALTVPAGTVTIEWQRANANGATRLCLARAERPARQTADAARLRSHRAGAHGGFARRRRLARIPARRTALEPRARRDAHRARLATFCLLLRALGSERFPGARLGGTRLCVQNDLSVLRHSHRSRHQLRLPPGAMELNEFANKFVANLDLLRPRNPSGVGPSALPHFERNRIFPDKVFRQPLGYGFQDLELLAELSERGELGARHISDFDFRFRVTLVCAGGA